MKRGKTVKPLIPVEYRLLITLKYEEREKKAVTYFTLKTVQEFSYFSYEIIVEPVIHDRTVQFNIHGLRAPRVTIPSAGPATFITKFEKLDGRYFLIISKNDKRVNRFTVNIKKNSIVVEENPTNKFIEIITDEKNW
ncbi:MAG: hypothetical protein QME52_01930 [Bacteroidota bacterium]|nr:hypothetical protein [Bacteroidota bacterium]